MMPVVAFDIQTQFIPAKGISNLEEPSGVLITIPAGKRICYATIGHWNPALEGSAGLSVSSFGGQGSEHVDFKKEHFKDGDKIEGIAQKECMAPDKNFFALLIREVPVPTDRSKRKHYTFSDG